METINTIAKENIKTIIGLLGYSFKSESRYKEFLRERVQIITTENRTDFFIDKDTENEQYIWGYSRIDEFTYEKNKISLVTKFIYDNIQSIH